MNIIKYSNKLKFNIPTELYNDELYNNLRRMELLLISELLEESDNFKKLKLTKKTELIILIELSCYNSTIEKATEYKYNNLFKNEIFEELYRSIISKVTKNIDINSEVNCNYLINNIIDNYNNNNISYINNIGYMTSYDLCPEKSENIIKMLDTRSKQHLSIKTSSLYTCKNCKKKEVFIREIQIRSLDEGTNLSITCCFCKNNWIQ